MKKSIRPTTTKYRAPAQDSMSAFRRDVVKRSRIDDPDQRGEEIEAEEVARVLGLAVSSVRTFASLGEIPAYRLFHRVKFFRNEIQQYRNNMLMVVK